MWKSYNLETKKFGKLLELKYESVGLRDNERKRNISNKNRKIIRRFFYEDKNEMELREVIESK